MVKRFFGPATVRKGVFVKKELFSTGTKMQGLYEADELGEHHSPTARSAILAKMYYLLPEVSE